MIFFAALSVFLMVVDARFTHLKRVREAMVAAVYPLQRAAQFPTSLLDKINAFFVTQQKLQQENVSIRQQLLEQSQRAQQLGALEGEVKVLRKLLGAKEHVPGGAVMVELLHVDRNPFLRKIVVNKGSRDGIAAGQAVIDADGVVGQVTLVSPLSSEITLITEKGQPIPVMVQRTGLRAVLFGSGRADSLDLPFVPVSADIETGDLLVTSGIDGTYPPGLPVAKVANIGREAALVFAKISCAPAAGVDRNKFYLVLQYRPQTAASISTESSNHKSKKNIPPVVNKEVGR